MDDVTLTKSDHSLIIIEHEVFIDKLDKQLLQIFKRSIFLSTNDEVSEGVTTRLTGIEIPKQSTTVVTTILRS